MLKRKDQDAVRAAFREAKDNGATGPELVMLGLELAFDCTPPMSGASRIVGEVKTELYEAYRIDPKDIFCPED